MPTFPAIAPASRTFTPGDYPHSPFVALSGEQSRVRHSDAVLGASLELEFIRLTEAERLSIETHYLGQYGEIETFMLSPETFSGFNAYDFNEGAGLWRYAEPPEIDDFCGPTHDVRVRLVSARGGVTGVEFNPITLAFTPGASTGASLSGLAITVAVSFLPGAVTTTTTGGEVSVYVPGMEGTVRATFAAGVGSIITVAQMTVVLHMDGTSGSTFFENQAQGNTLTAEVYGSAAIATDFKKWGTGSGRFSFPTSGAGYTGHAVAFDDPVLAPATGDFTIECWIYLPTDDPIRAETILQVPTSNPGQGRIRVGGSAELIWTGTAGELTHQTTITYDVWHHVWAVRESGTVKIALDGVQASSTLSDPTNYPFTPGYSGRKLVIGNYTIGSTYGFGGRIDDLRFTNGQARALSVPTGPYPNS